MKAQDALAGTLDHSLDLVLRRSRASDWLRWVAASVRLLLGDVGGRRRGVFFRPEARGRGVAAALVARVCTEVRAGGGVFLRGSHDQALAPFHEQVVNSWPLRETSLSAIAHPRRGGAPEVTDRLVPSRSERVA
jgi:GNAT superfamily N-acetyltransferase